MTAATALVVGDGIAGLASARALAQRGFRVRILGRRLPGAASGAAAGLLAPSLGQASPAVRALMRRARDLWPGFAAELGRETGRTLEVNRRGILETALDREAFERLVANGPEWAEPLDAVALGRLEPALGHAAGALLHPGDGAVDNAAVLAALDAACARDPRTERLETIVVGLRITHGSVAAHDDLGKIHVGDLAVLAPGAWLGGIQGVPTRLPVAPRRGQMLALDGAPIAHCLAGNGVYVVPRGGRSVVGSTLEDVGFDATTTEEAIGRLRRAAAGLVPALAAAPEAARWAGLRPMTPDALPRLGRDPAEPRVLHAAGLSKNGILLAPLVADAVAALATGGTVPDLAPFGLAQHAG